MKITTTQNIELTPKDLAEIFCGMNNYEQAESLDEIASIFYDWGDFENNRQAEMIMNVIKAGQSWIELLMENKKK